MQCSAGLDFLVKMELLWDCGSLGPEIVKQKGIRNVSIMELWVPGVRVCAAETFTIVAKQNPTTFLFGKTLQNTPKQKFDELKFER
jgi:hypothetical protein